LQLGDEQRTAAIGALAPAAAKEYDAALREAQLVAGPAVREALRTYSDWFDRVSDLLIHATDMSRLHHSFHGWDAVEAELMDAMRAELGQLRR
jgi:hypothetical protein